MSNDETGTTPSLPQPGSALGKSPLRVASALGTHTAARSAETPTARWHRSPFGSSSQHRSPEARAMPHEAREAAIRPSTGNRAGRDESTLTRDPVRLSTPSTGRWVRVRRKAEGGQPHKGVISARTAAFAMRSAQSAALLRSGRAGGANNISSRIWATTTLPAEPGVVGVPRSHRACSSSLRGSGSHGRGEGCAGLQSAAGPSLRVHA